MDECSWCRSSSVGLTRVRHQLDVVSFQHQLVLLGSWDCAGHAWREEGQLSAWVSHTGTTCLAHQGLYRYCIMKFQYFQGLFKHYFESLRTTIRHLIYQTYILIKATYVIQSRAASDFLFFFCSLSNINETDSSGFIRGLSLRPDAHVADLTQVQFFQLFTFI